MRSLSGVFSVAVVAWYAGSAPAGRAGITVLALSANVYVIIYATSVRMYSMETFLVFAGILAVRRAFERPSIERLASSARVVAILIYTQYWGFYIVWRSPSSCWVPRCALRRCARRRCGCSSLSWSGS